MCCKEIISSQLSTIPLIVCKHYSVGPKNYASDTHSLSRRISFIMQNSILTHYFQKYNDSHAHNIKRETTIFSTSWKFESSISCEAKSKYIKLPSECAIHGLNSYWFVLLANGIKILACSGPAIGHLWLIFCTPEDAWDQAHTMGILFIEQSKTFDY